MSRHMLEKLNYNNMSCLAKIKFEKTTYTFETKLGKCKT